MKKLIIILVAIFVAEAALLVFVTTKRAKEDNAALHKRIPPIAASAAQTSTANPFDEPSELEKRDAKLIKAADEEITGQPDAVLDFENKADFWAVESRKGSDKSSEKASRGTSSLRVQPGDYLNIRTPKLATSKTGDLLRIDFYNDTKSTKPIRIEIFDDNTDYWNRHVREHQLRPGWTTLSFPVQALPKGEKNSQRKKGFLDPTKIKRIDIDLSRVDDGFIYIDNIRFQPDDPMPVVAGLRAFDMGPESQTVRWGFTGSTNESFTPERGHGWKSTRANVRDYFHPNTLLGDFRDSWGDTFSVTVPDGRYHVLVFYEEHGWWEDQFLEFETRNILAQGKPVVIENRTRQDSERNFFRFADTEPLPGMDIYDTYIRNGRYKPHEFDADVTGGRLDIGFASDRPMACRVSAIIFWPEESQKPAEVWLDELHKRMKAEFNREQIYIPSLNKKEPAEVNGLVVFTTGTNPAGPEYVPSQQEIIVDSVKLTEPTIHSSHLIALPGEHTGFPFAVRSEKGTNITIAVKLDGMDTAVSLVQNRIQRIDGGFTVLPDILKSLPDVVAIPANITRQFWAEIAVPPELEAGVYKGQVTIVQDRQIEIAFPVTVTVIPFKPGDSVMPYGLFGLGQDEFAPRTGWPGNVVDLLRSHGMTSIGGMKLGHVSVKDGELVLDCSEGDAIMAALKEHGFKLPVDTYGGGGISGIGEAAQKLNISPDEAARRAYSLLRQHAEEASWLPVTLSVVDEPHWSDEAVTSAADSVRALKKAAPWLTINGYWSPNAGNTFHRNLMDALDRTTMGAVLPKTVDYLKANNKQYGYYGGADRMSFGLRQFSALEEGFASHYAWHFYIRYGDLYYDLDSREPDVCMVYYGPEGIRPSLRLKAVRAGAQDFRALVLLAQLAKENPGSAKEANKLLDEARAAGNIYGAKGRIESPDEFRKKVYEAIMRITPHIAADEVE